LKAKRNCDDAGDDLLTLGRGGSMRGPNLLAARADGPVALDSTGFRSENRTFGAAEARSEGGMRRKAWSRAVLGLLALASALATAMPPARAQQMCTPAIKDCESEADAEAQRCASQCQRYDTICADRCDDTHDIIVRYCWIKRALCKAPDESKGPVKASSERN
jgi:hypothetical protein